MGTDPNAKTELEEFKVWVGELDSEQKKEALMALNKKGFPSFHLDLKKYTSKATTFFIINNGSIWCGSVSKECFDKHDEDIKEVFASALLKPVGYKLNNDDAAIAEGIRKVTDDAAWMQGVKPGNGVSDDTAFIQAARDQYNVAHEYGAVGDDPDPSAIRDGEDKSYVRNCYIERRNDNDPHPMFTDNPKYGGLLKVHLDNYAIIPMEKYDEMKAVFEDKVKNVSATKKFFG